MTVIGKSIGEIQKLLKSKEISAVGITRNHFDYIEEKDKSTRAFLSLTKELALQQAKQVDNLIASGKPLPPLAGIPVAIKDNICVASYHTTCASKILENFSPIYNATVSKLIFEAGGICIGKTNLDEFAMGSSTENSAFAKTANPWNLDFVPGGSSGGSACATAAGFSTIALGSDTGGSVRQPASFCGVIGMKPTYGLISRYGLVAFASSLDQVGPFARTVEDTIRTLAVIAQHDPHDSTSLPESSHKQINFDKLLSNLPNLVDLKGIKIGIIEELTGQANDTSVRSSIEKAIKNFTELGAKLDVVSIPQVKNALPVYYIIAPAEASANLARYDGVKYGYRTESAQNILEMYFASRQAGFGPEVKRRIMLGTYVLSSGYYDAYYKKAQQVRRLLTEDFNKVFKSYDLVISPTSPVNPFKFGARTHDPLQMYMSDVASIPANLAGLPALSIPCGFDDNQMPIGLQLMGPSLSDEQILKAAYLFEKTTDYNKKRPPMLQQAVLAKK